MYHVVPAPLITLSCVISHPRPWTRSLASRISISINPYKNMRDCFDIPQNARFPNLDHFFRELPFPHKEDVNERLARCAGGSPSGNVLVGPSGRDGPCHKSPGSPAGALPGDASGGCYYDNAAPRSEAESSSEVSCFGNERGSSVDEGGYRAVPYRTICYHLFACFWGREAGTLLLLLLL